MQMRWRYATGGALIVAAVVAAAMWIAAPKWPDLTASQSDIDYLTERFEGVYGSYHETSYKAYMAEHDAFGDYLNYGKWKGFREGGNLILTEDGLPRIVYEGQPYWNPVTLSQYALTMYGRVLLGDPQWEDELFRAIDVLVQTQNPDGGWPYPAMPNGPLNLPDNWYSGMAQGQALSAMSRALRLRDDPTIRHAAELAFQNLVTPLSEGGTMADMSDLDPTLAGYVFYPEYPTEPLTYTLNGYMFTLLGLYDWSQVDSPSQARAKEAFERGIDTLEHILPYYDVAGMTSYDLGHFILPGPPQVRAHPTYMGVHVYLLHALQSITGSEVMAYWEKRWDAKLEAMNQLLKIVSMAPDKPSPQPAGETIRFTVTTGGGDGGEKFYKYMVKFGTEWSMLKDWSTESVVEWTPAEPGEYVVAFYVKDAASERDFDNYRNQKFTVE